MKKIISIAYTLLMFYGCNETTPIHTFYGNFNPDTLKVYLDDSDGSTCYLVHTEFSDTFKTKNGTINIQGPIEIYYNPQKDIYYKKYPVSGNGSRILKYNPNDNSYDE